MFFFCFFFWQLTPWPYSSLRETVLLLSKRLCCTHSTCNLLSSNLFLKWIKMTQKYLRVQLIDYEIQSYHHVVSANVRLSDAKTAAAHYMIYIQLWNDFYCTSTLFFQSDRFLSGDTTAYILREDEQVAWTASGDYVLFFMMVLLLKRSKIMFAFLTASTQVKDGQGWFISVLK